MPESPVNGFRAGAGVSRAELSAMRRQIATFELRPRFSLAVAITDPREIWVRSTVQSVFDQIYEEFELWICDNGSRSPDLAGLLEDLAAGDPRVRLLRLGSRGSRPEALNAAMAEAGGDFIALLDAGDALAPDALFRMAELEQDARADAIYSDEVLIDEVDEPIRENVKPGWSPDLLLSTPYVGRLCAIRRELVDAVGGLRAELDGAEEHDLLLRVSERTRRIHHLATPLYRRRMLPERDASSQREEEASSRAIAEALARRSVRGVVKNGMVKGSFRVIHHVDERARVSAVVWAPSHPEGEEVAARLSRTTAHPIHQLILVGRQPGAASAAAHVAHGSLAAAANLAVERTDAEYLLFMDGRGRIAPGTGSGWLTEMVTQAQRDDVGGVGCRILDPGGNVRYGGAVVDLSRLYGELFPPPPISPRDYPLSLHPFNPPFVQAECMVVSKAAFESVGGFDAEHLPGAFFDLDLSFRFSERGLLLAYTPYPAVVCPRSQRAPSADELAYIWNRWWEPITSILDSPHLPRSVRLSQETSDQPPGSPAVPAPGLTRVAQ